jgi:hypothetical protein
MPANMPAKTASDLSVAKQNVDEAMKLVSRGGDRVQLAVQHLAFALNDLIGQLDG